MNAVIQTDRNLVVNALSNVRAFQCAVSHRFDPFEMFLSPTNLGDHRLWKTPTEPRNSISVISVTLDLFFAEWPGSIDVVKLDAQGSEGIILDGGREFFKKYRPVLFLELWPIGLAHTGKTTQDIARQLSEWGYVSFQCDEKDKVLRKVDDITTMIAQDSPDFVNLVCVRK